jgi:hypothetical protein
MNPGSSLDLGLGGVVEADEYEEVDITAMGDAARRTIQVKKTAYRQGKSLHEKVEEAAASRDVVADAFRAHAWPVPEGALIDDKVRCTRCGATAARVKHFEVECEAAAPAPARVEVRGVCCDDPRPMILEKTGRMFCASCRRYLDVSVAAT